MQATTVAAQGTAETDFNLAGFSVALSAEGKTAPEAKANLKKQVDLLSAVVSDFTPELGVTPVKNSVQTSTNVRENWQYVDNNREFVGFIAAYNYTFQIADLDKVSAVYDVLSNLEEATVSSPQFSIKTSTRDRVNKKALKDAFAKVKERFDCECSILGLNPDDFEIASWEATYSDSHRSDRVAAATRSVGASGGARVAMAYSATIESASAAPEYEPLEIVVGKAKVTANLEVGYARKAVQPAVLKAKVVRSSPLEESQHV